MLVDPIISIMTHIYEEAIEKLKSKKKKND